MTNKIRKPIVAGQFYTANPHKLEMEIDNYLKNVKLEKEYDNIFAIISPHAGYVFSAQTAAYGFKCLQGKQFGTVIVIAPSHNPIEFSISVCDCDYYQTPLGDIPVDKKIMGKLLKSDIIGYSEIAHKREHSLEVQLPFLQMVLTDFKLVPILIGYQSLETSRNLAEILYLTLKDMKNKFLFVISTDLSHYHSAETAKVLDDKVIDAVKKMDAELLEDYIRSGKAEACGYGCVETGIMLAEKFGIGNVDILNYSHSGMIFGDYAQVVGYLSAVFY
ncbi:MAG: AmmeMemoRadiSam system protein B [Candidatus Cloacimonetes bacterium]|nr:AmmeMemoRadiSam system protein B [Candidatus Cloacimonadota bacterium]